MVFDFEGYVLNLLQKIFEAGKLPNGSIWFFQWIPVSSFSKIKQNITAICGLVSPVSAPSKVLGVYHKSRGWDMPGGHVEAQEEPIDTLKRELKEECQSEIRRAEPLTILRSTFYPGKETYIVIYRVTAVIGSFVKNEEILRADLFSPSDFLKNYSGNKELLQEIYSENNYSFCPFDKL